MKKMGRHCENFHFCYEKLTFFSGRLQEYNGAERVGRRRTGEGRRGRRPSPKRITIKAVYRNFSTDTYSISKASETPLKQTLPSMTLAPSLISLFSFIAFFQPLLAISRA